jgi:hypothetical protein
VTLPGSSAHRELGSTTSQRLPGDSFDSGGGALVRRPTEGQAEQPRVMLFSVPYALKAGDAATVGGLPPSAFVLAAPGWEQHQSGINHPKLCGGWGAKFPTLGRALAQQAKYYSAGS